MPHMLRWCSIVCALLGAPAVAQAQASFPDRPIRLVVAFPPGGATDTLARQITQELGEALGQSVVIENKPGAGGYIAWNHVADSSPDGYTLLMAENAIGISQALYKKATSPFDPMKQYDAIAAVATSPLVLAAANNLMADSVAELIAYARTVPQKINYATAGIGSVSHLTFEVIKAATGIEAVHVPYKGGGPAMNDVIAGHVALNMAAIQVAKGLVETGKIKGLWVIATNPAHSWINQGRFAKLREKLEFLVVQDMYHSTETAKMADLVLPAAGWGEKDGVFINSERRLGLTRKVSRAPGQALSDFSIFKLIAEVWDLL